MGCYVSKMRPGTFGEGTNRHTPPTGLVDPPFFCHLISDALVGLIALAVDSDPNTSTQQPDIERRTMDLHEAQTQLTAWLHEATLAFQKVPGSAVLIRYVQSSYQNDPIRSAIELVLVIFFVRYLLSPSYSTHKQNFIKLRDDVGALPASPPPGCRQPC